MANLWQALRDSMENMRNEYSDRARAHVKPFDVYSRTEECRAYCAAEGSGLEFVLEGESCLCQESRHELLKRDVVKHLEKRQSPPPEVQSAMSICSTASDRSSCMSSAVEGTSLSTSGSATATVTTTTSASTSGHVESSGTALETGAAITSSAGDASSTPATTTGINSASPYPSADGLGATIPTDQSKAHSNGGLSQGAKIGLGVGLGIGAAILIAAIVLFCLARRRRRNSMTMGAKYAPAQSELSMVEAPYPAAAGVGHVRETPKEYNDPPQYEPPHYEQYEHGHEPVEDHREAIEEVDDRASEDFEPPPHNVFQTPVNQSPITPLESQAAYNRSFTNAPLALTIPTAAGGAASPHSRDLSPAGGGSPVSPVSPISAVSPINSRPSSPARHP